MTEFATSAAPSRGGMRFKHIALLSITAFAGGIGASWWLANEYGWFGSDMPAAGQTMPVTTTPLAPSPAPVLVDSVLASGNSARAEGLLVAFAARRAIDNGAPLGYLADQLRLRFGSSQPQAVLTVLQASQTPVTLPSLQADLNAMESLLVLGAREETPWTTVQREFSELFVLRKSDTPSLAPAQRMVRAQALVESGNVGGAIADVSAMPGASAIAAQNWLRRARNYDGAQKALDGLERSMLAAPPVMTGPVAPAPSNQQTLPLPVPE
ncbi:MAG TPA: hypothetical protein VGN36_00390 [Sphingorhabdus sp.]|jgi:hypothetical protein|nr:hypothetical protein [Sphingorhabdus sp.]